MSLLFLIAVVVAVAVTIALSLSHGRRANEAWTEAARRLGLRFEPGGVLESRKMSGYSRACRVMVDTYRQSSGKHSRTCTRFRVTYPRPLGLGLKLTRQGFMSGVLKVFGAQDIAVGDGPFDSDVVVKGADPRRVREFLTPSRRLRIHRFLSTYRGAAIEDGEINWSTQELLRHSGRIVSAVEAMTRLAWHLTGDRESDEIMNRAMAAQDEGHPEEAMRILRDSPKNLRPASATPPPLISPFTAPLQSDPPPRPSPIVWSVPASEAQALPVPEAAPQTETGLEDEPEPVEEYLLEGEILHLAGRTEEARECFERARRAAPDDLEIEQWAKTIDPEETVEKHPEEGSGCEWDAVSVCEELFSRNSWFEANRVFENEYAGREVEWTGILRRADGYLSDLVFGREPGCKAVIEAHRIPAVYGSQVIHAVVQLPRESLDTLRRRIGQQVTFRGRLLKADGLMRNIYIGEGCLVG